MIGLLCKLPRWLGGGHKWRRLTKKEIFFVPNSGNNKRICRRCGITRLAKARKTKTKEMTNE